MGFFQDLAPVFKKSTIRFARKQKEIDDIWSFFFELDGAPFWKAGQHGTFSFAQKLEGRSWHGYSVTSSPGEKMIQIATRVKEQPSAYKKALMALQPGDAITMRGPFGPFYLNKPSKPAVFIAGGIGITPYRAMILDALQTADKAPASIHLLYSDDSRHYVFQKELDDAAAQRDFLTIHYLTKETLAEEVSRKIRHLGNDAIYYISGSAAMVKSIKQSLKEQGILKRNIRNELFLGL